MIFFLPFQIICFFLFLDTIKRGPVLVISLLLRLDLELEFSLTLFYCINIDIIYI
jgi:hypothetical protein